MGLCASQWKHTGPQPNNCVGSCSAGGGDDGMDTYSDGLDGDDGIFGFFGGPYGGPGVPYFGWGDFDYGNIYASFDEGEAEEAGSGSVPGGGASGQGANNGQTPQQAATQYCQQHGQLSFNIPFTKIPVTISLSATLGPANYSATNDISAVFPVIPWPEWLAAGASVDVTVNSPAEPSSNPNVGLGKNLSVGYFTTPNGPQGLSLSVGPSIGPPINISVPTNNACGMLVGGKG
jgi:hypothetical protein